MTFAAGLALGWVGGLLTIPALLIVLALRLGVTWAECEEDPPMMMEPIAIATARALPFLARHWKAIALAGLVAVAGVQSWRVARLKADVVTADAAARDPISDRPWAEIAAERERNLTQCRTNRDSLRGELDRQSLAVEALAAEGAARLAAADRAAELARAGQSAAEARASRIDRIVTSASCPEVDAIFEEAFQ